jgi:hypothetical protein
MQINLADTIVPCLLLKQMMHARSYSLDLTVKTLLRLRAGLRGLYRKMRVKWVLDVTLFTDMTILQNIFTLTL